MRNKYFISFFIIFGCFISNNLYSKDFWGALAQIESSNNPKAVGDNLKAIGIYQIHENYFKDAAEFDKSLQKYEWKDCFAPEISKKVEIAYMSRYEKKALNNNDFETLSRAHNGGCGWRKNPKLTNSYWQKIKKNLG